MSRQITAYCSILCKWAQQQQCFLAQRHAGSSCFIHETWNMACLSLMWPNKSACIFSEKFPRGNGSCIWKNLSLQLCIWRHWLWVNAACFWGTFEGTDWMQCKRSHRQFEDEMVFFYFGRTIGSGTLTLCKWTFPQTSSFSEDNIRLWPVNGWLNLFCMKEPLAKQQSASRCVQCSWAFVHSCV